MYVIFQWKIRMDLRQLWSWYCWKTILYLENCLSSYRKYAVKQALLVMYWGDFVLINDTWWAGAYMQYPGSPKYSENVQWERRLCGYNAHPLPWELIENFECLEACVSLWWHAALSLCTWDFISLLMKETNNPLYTNKKVKVSPIYLNYSVKFPL